MAWVRDVEVQNTPLSTTGGHTWAAAYRLADYLEAAAPQLGLESQGLHVLELGAGCGWLGMTLARNLPGAALVCLTEQQEGGACDWLRHNVDHNLRQRSLPLGCVRVQPCDWLRYAPPCDDGSGGGVGQQQPSAEAAVTAEAKAAAEESSGRQGWSSGQRGLVGSAAAAAADVAASGASSPAHPAECLISDATAASCSMSAAAEEGEEGGQLPVQHQQLQQIDLEAVEWDLILGSDLIYNQVGSTCLPRVLAALAGSAATILYCHTKHRFDLLDMEFMEGLAAAGLQCEEVWEPGTSPPPASPPPTFPPESLFPEQRIAVYRISKGDRVG